MTTQSINIKKIIDDFLNNFPKDDVYNEFSLQHELGIYLRNRLKGTQYKVQFERNSRDLGIDTKVKHKIDIVVISRDKKEKIAAIELKYPTNGRYPEEMFDFCKDICFMEEIHCGGFKHTYCLTYVEDHNYYDANGKGSLKDGIYAYFRAKALLPPKDQNIVPKPTGKPCQPLEFKGHYTIKWEPCGKGKYYFLEVNPPKMK